ncbi:UNVERIFIED_CONTAM: hypothetical protein Sradi_0083900 [Sesamum radiatum]|uniref:R13L1/DRL21-like LRR repeat region domain-containing protein n=1 Tax=Sesamum radiatum TaxID=300843 RepID=A0AAW2WMD3_SESRA
MQNTHQGLTIWFINATGRTDEDELLRNEAMEALQPPPNLQYSTIIDYQGKKFPSWISSSLNHLKVLQIQVFNNISTLPCLGRLLQLEELSVRGRRKLKFVGREFLGISADQWFNTIVGCGDQLS